MHALLIVDEILANRAQEYPCIYDKSDKDHRRQSITSSLWKKDTHKVKVLSLSLLIVLYTLQLRKYSQFCLDFRLFLMTRLNPCWRKKRKRKILSAI